MIEDRFERPRLKTELRFDGPRAIICHSFPDPTTHACSLCISPLGEGGLGGDCDLGLVLGHLDEVTQHTCDVSYTLRSRQGRDAGLKDQLQTYSSSIWLVILTSSSLGIVIIIILNGFKGFIVPSHGQSRFTTPPPPLLHQFHVFSILVCGSHRIRGSLQQNSVKIYREMLIAIYLS